MIIFLNSKQALKLYKRFTNLYCLWYTCLYLPIVLVFICAGKGCRHTIRHHKQFDKVTVEEVITPPNSPSGVSNTSNDSTSSHSTGGLVTSTGSPTAPIPPSIPDSVSSSKSNSHNAGSTAYIPPTSNAYPTPPASPAKQWHGFSGIPNLGNTCFMNSVLQVVAAIYAPNVRGALKTLVEKINSQPVETTDVNAFREDLQEAARGLAYSGRHEDAHEFLTQLHDQYGFLYTYNTIRTYRRNGRRRGSEIYLDINFDGSNVHFTENDNECIDPEDVMSDIRLKTTLEFSSLSLLCAHAKRFRNDGTKILTKIHQPDPMMIGDTAFHLKAFIVHIGSELNRGHYIAYVQRNGQWYEADDNSITPIAAAEAIKQSEDAYLLFYEK